MGLFKKAKPEPFPFSPEEYEPVIRSSICTGERTACMRRREDGRLREIMLLRSEGDLDAFCRMVGKRADEIRTVY